MSNQTLPNFWKFIQYAVLAGIFGSLSSVFGKLSTETTQNILFTYVSKYTSSTNISYILRVSSFGLNFFCTGLMWTYYIESLQKLSALTASVVNTGSNFIFTSIFGMLIFGEVLSLRYYLGLFILIFGLSLIVYGEKD